VEVAWASVDKLFDEFRDIGSGSPVRRQVTDLLLGGNLTSEEEPEETWQILEHIQLSILIGYTFRQRLLSSGCLWQKLLALWNGVSSESNTLLGIKD
jgi:hypothetical protein